MRRVASADVASARLDGPDVTGKTETRSPDSLPELELPEDMADITTSGPLNDPRGTVDKFLQSAEMREWNAKAEAFNRGRDTSASLNAVGEAVADKSDEEWDALDTTLDESGVPGIFAKVARQLDDAFNRHSAFVSDSVNEVRRAGLNVEDLFLTDEASDTWSDAVTEYANGVVDRLMARNLRQEIPRAQKSLVLGGLPGAGKSTIIKTLGINDSKDPSWVSLNPDDIKEVMIADGVFPKIDGLSPMETVGAIHELSSFIAKMYTAETMKAGFNVIHDVTLGNERAAGKITGLLDKFGYESDAIFVDVSVGMSAKSQVKRHVRGLNALRAGEDTEGGRFVPTFVLEGAVPRTKDSKSLNYEVFSGMRDSGAFRRWGVVNNENYRGEALAVGTGAKASDGDAVRLFSDPATAPGIFA